MSLLYPHTTFNLPSISSSSVFSLLSAFVALHFVFCFFFFLLQEPITCIHKTFHCNSGSEFVVLQPHLLVSIQFKQSIYATYNPSQQSCFFLRNLGVSQVWQEYTLCFPFECVFISFLLSAVLCVLVSVIGWLKPWVVVHIWWCLCDAQSFVSVCVNLKCVRQEISLFEDG